MTCHDVVRFIPGIQDWYNNQNSISIIDHINKPKKKNHTTILTDAEENSW